MTANQLHLKQHVGTTYKRALERFHHSRDAVIPKDFSVLRLIDRRDNWSVRPRQTAGQTMRKPRDFDAELRALNDKAKLLRDRKLVQLGELVVATGADTLPVEILAGALLAAIETKDSAAKEVWRKSGAAFFHRRPRDAADGGGRPASRGTANEGGAKPPAADAGAS